MSGLSEILEGFLFLAGCYLAGSVPFAYIVVRAVKGVDIRSVGSGNAGATNAGRILGKGGFFLVFFLDLLKGFVPVYLAYRFCGPHFIVLLAVLAVVLGHTFTIFLSFKGGKGVATAAGAFLAVAPFEVLAALVVFLAVFAAFRMVSAASLAAALALLAGIFIVSDWTGLKIFTALIVALVFFMHRSNISRIIRGEESRIGSGK